MINKIVDIHEITYIKSDSKDLIESIAKRGIAIPVQVKVLNGRYQCIDGHKRLSACAILLKKDKRFRRIPIMILNDYSKAGSAFWGNTRNQH